MQLTRPEPAELLALQEHLSVALLGYDTELVRLYRSDFLPRHHRLTLDFHNRSAQPFERVFITVHRDGSKYGSENFETIPLSLPELLPRTQCRYAVLSFDAFNRPFSSMRVNLTTPAECARRRPAPRYMQRAHPHAKFLGGPSSTTVA